VNFFPPRAFRVLLSLLGAFSSRAMGSRSLSREPSPSDRYLCGTPSVFFLSTVLNDVVISDFYVVTNNFFLFPAHLEKDAEGEPLYLFSILVNGRGLEKNANPPLSFLGPRPSSSESQRHYPPLFRSIQAAARLTRAPNISPPFPFSLSYGSPPSPSLSAFPLDNPEPVFSIPAFARFHKPISRRPLL